MPGLMYFSPGQTLKHQEMKKIQFSFLFILAMGLVFQSCEDDFDLATDPDDFFETKGAVATFTAPIPDFFDTGAPEQEVFFTVDVLGEDFTGARILKNFNNTGNIEHASILGFPNTLRISLLDALEGTGVSVDDLKVGDAFVFSFEVTTASGTYVTGSRITIPVSCSNKFPGTYDFVSTDYFCGGDPLSGSVTITETEAGKYTFSDWGFGSYQECYGSAASSWGTLAFVRYTSDECDECSQSAECNTISIEGADSYGDSWAFSIEKVEGTELTMSWTNDYGEFGTVVLSRPDGSNWPPLQ